MEYLLRLLRFSTRRNLVIGQMATLGVLHARNAGASLQEGWSETTTTAAETDDSVVDMMVDDKGKCLKNRVEKR